MKRSEFQRFQSRYQPEHQAFFSRPYFSRRAFLQAAGGVAGSLMLPSAATAAPSDSAAATKNTARNLIFILLSGGPSHVDTFDLKMIDGVSPAALGPERVNGILWPAGLLPKLGSHLSSMAIIRSMRSWALVHETGQRWLQVGRNPQGAEGSIAPHIGSIIAREKDAEQRPTDSFPPFVALDVNEAAGAGYFSARYAPLKYIPSAAGIPDTAHPAGERVFQARLKALADLDGRFRRVDSPVSAGADVAEFYDAAVRMMHNPVVERAFRLNPTDAERYGSTAFGNACLVAKQVLEENQGTRAVMIRLGGWDSHSNIYSTTTPTSIFSTGKTFDNALSALLADLESSGQLNETLVVAGGEFGRTPGPLSAAGGRDHYLQQSFLLAGGGIRGGRVIGATDATGDATSEYGWSRDRDVRVEDIEATIYSALGIDWTKVLDDGPRGPFPYIPHSDKDLYGPVNELWS